MSKKLYIRQVNPEHQESPLMWDDAAFDGIAVYGNPRMNAHIGIPELEIISRNFDEAASDYDYYIRGRSYDTEESEESYTLPEILERYGLIKERAAYTESELNEWVSLFNLTQYHDSCDEEIFLPALQLMTGKVYNRLTIRGCCQGDWQYIVYPLDDWTMDEIRAFEAEYFNTGSEWLVDEDGEYDPESGNPGEINGVSYYLTEYDEDKIRKFFADEYRMNPADIVLYKWVGTRRVDVYAAV